MLAASRALASGGLVIFPTETVYGLGIDADSPVARENVYRLKARDQGKPLTIHLADPGDLRGFVASPPPAARRLIGRFWPGPLTLLLAGPDGKTLGFRCPANDLARELIRQSKVTVAATSVNRSGEAPAVDSVGLAPFVTEARDSLAYVFDTGPTRLQQASTVVSVTGSGWKIVRAGVLSPFEIKEAAVLRVLLVCGGNTCRSHMAESLLRSLLCRRHGIPGSPLEQAGYFLASAGTSAGTGAPASDHARETMKAQGLDLSGHRSRHATPALLREAHRIFVMTDSHRQVVLHLLAGATFPRVDLLDPDGRDVSDPFGGSLEDYQRTAARLRALLEKRLEEL